MFHRLSIRIVNKQFFLEINLFVLLTLVLAFVSGYLKEYSLSFLGIVLHEGGHIAAAVILEKRINGIKILPLGIKGYIDEGTLSNRERILVLLSGPFVNIFLFIALLISVPAFGIPYEKINYFLLVNASLAVFNLVPIIPLDGGRILRELIAEKTGLFFAENLIRKETMIISLIIIFAGIIQTILNPKNISLLTVGIYTFLLIISDDREVALVNVKNIIIRRKKLLEKGLYPARGLTATKYTRLVEVMKNMDYDRFHFIYVLDDGMRLLRIFTEQEIIDEMLKYSSDITFGDLLKLKATELSSEQAKNHTTD